MERFAATIDGPLYMSPVDRAETRLLSCRAIMKKPRLVVISGPWAGAMWLIPANGLRVGRNPDKNDVVLDDATVSARHASFYIVDGQSFVRDEGSDSGIA